MLEGGYESESSSDIERWKSDAQIQQISLSIFYIQENLQLGLLKLGSLPWKEMVYVVLRS